MKFLSWNVRCLGLAGRLDGVVAAIGEERPDILLLQEVHSPLLATVTAAFAEIELVHALDSENGAPPRPSRFSTKKPRAGYVTLIASRWPVTRADDAWRENAPHPEAMVRATIQPQEGPAIDVFNVHIPNGSTYGWCKIETLDVLYCALVRGADQPRILCGDFNEPRYFRRSGQVVSFGPKVHRDDGLSDTAVPWTDSLGITRPSSDWARGVMQVLSGAPSHGLRDVYRSVNGFDEVPITYKTSANPRCFDHGFASRHFTLTSARYRHDWRTSNLSDHSALVFEANLRGDVGPLMQWGLPDSDEEPLADVE